MRLVFAGTPEVALPALDALVASEHEVVAVVTRPDAKAGRGKKLVASPVGRRATELGIEVLKPKHPRDPDFVDRLTEIAPDCCPVVAYGALVPAHVIEIPKHGWVNLHFSLLPRWRGAAPVQHAIMAGDTETGAAVFSLVPALDAGDVYAELREPLTDTDTAGDVLERLAHSGADLLVEVMDAVAAGTASATAQPDDGITLAPKITTDDARLDWTRPDVELDRQIRGCTPAPGAWTTLGGETQGGERFKILAATPAGGEVLTPGLIRAERNRLLVGTGSRPLEVTRLQPPGKKPMAAADWARGANLAADAHFDPSGNTGANQEQPR